jgi:3-phosphoshikimate 1-carboxyvinyltransferase
MTAALRLPSVSIARGAVDLPGSKSISNRVLLLAALSQGATRLTGLLDSEDTRVMLAALRQLGVTIDEPDVRQALVHGTGGFTQKHGDFFLGNAGTAFRPLVAALAFMGGDYRLAGVPRMHQRPIGDLVEALRRAGAQVRYLGEQGYPPLAVGEGRIRSNEPIRVRGAVSSQFLTALLLAAPIHTSRTGETITVEVDGELISKPYILITLNLMARFGVQVQRTEWQRFVIPGNAVYRSPGLVAIEGDASSASYFMALGAIGGGPVEIRGVGAQSIQGDIAFADTLEAMGAAVRRRAQSFEVSGVRVALGEKLKAFDGDFNLIPDAAMTAAALALFADGPCTLRNIGSWRVKETDRIQAMSTELAKLGARTESGPDWLRIHPVEFSHWRAASIATYDDHRMAMCFSLASFGPVPIIIQDPGCVAKTFPDYFTVFKGLIRA